MRTELPASPCDLYRKPNRATVSISAHAPLADGDDHDDDELPIIALLRSAVESIQLAIGLRPFDSALMRSRWPRAAHLTMAPDALVALLARAARRIDAVSARTRALGTATVGMSGPTVHDGSTSVSAGDADHSAARAFVSSTSSDSDSDSDDDDGDDHESRTFASRARRLAGDLLRSKPVLLTWQLYALSLPRMWPLRAWLLLHIGVEHGAAHDAVAPVPTMTSTTVIY